MLRSYQTLDSGDVDGQRSCCCFFVVVCIRVGECCTDSSIQARSPHCDLKASLLWHVFVGIASLLVSVPAALSLYAWNQQLWSPSFLLRRQYARHEVISLCLIGMLSTTVNDSGLLPVLMILFYLRRSCKMAYCCNSNRSFLLHCRCRADT